VAEAVTVIDGALFGKDEEFHHVAFLVNEFLPRPAFPGFGGQVFASGYFEGSAGKHPAIPAGKPEPVKLGVCWRESAAGGDIASTGRLQKCAFRPAKDT
jgi:hypothetical protein